MKYSYQIYSPSGNDTALVLPLEQDAEKRRLVARQIMKLHPKVEQVGFLSSKKPQLFMAGGEFCGNALRAAASFYLADRAGELKMEVSGTGGHALKAGRTLSGEVYAQMLGPHRIHELVEAREDFFLVRLPGIVQVIMPCHKKQVQGLSLSNIKEQAVRILQVLDLMQEPAAGVIFVTKDKGRRRIVPCVRVAAVDTMICESACGSGTVAAGLAVSFLTGKNVDIPIGQPSGQIIRAQIWRKGEMVTEGRISGQVSTDDRRYSLNIGKG